MSALDELAYYVLEGDEVRLVTFAEFSRWLNRPFAKTRHIAKTTVDDAEVSTVFLTADHNWGGRGGPILFETMIFGGPWNGGQWRYRTKAEAVKGHDQIVGALKAGQEPRTDWAA